MSGRPRADTALRLGEYCPSDTDDARHCAKQKLKPSRRHELRFNA